MVEVEKPLGKVKKMRPKLSEAMAWRQHYVDLVFKVGACPDSESMAYPLY